MDIDYVIPFVDCADSKWIDEYRKHYSGKSVWSNNAKRFRNHCNHPWLIFPLNLRQNRKYQNVN